MPWFNWTRELTEFFVNALADECRAGNRPHKTLNRNGKDNVVQRLRDKCGCDVKWKNCKSKWEELKKKWSCWKHLTKLSGVTFDPNTKLINMPKPWWDAQIQANEVAKAFQHSRLEHEELLDLIFFPRWNQ
ncbi:hypothetical protein BS78_05G046000 [Paspalum vaginatum]|nr:hypothetical protein BS78_05G046000 [Paspalum vaginatum]